MAFGMLFDDYNYDYSPGDNFIAFGENSDYILSQYPDNSVMAMAYGNIKMSSNNSDVEYRLQRLERGQILTRRTRVIPTFPSFKSQSFISQTSANNPFVNNVISGQSFYAGNIPIQIAPFTNSQIRYPRSPR